MKVGDKCTVAHHSGHTDTEQIKTIKAIYNEARNMKSGIAVKVTGLKWTVDSSLINLVTKKK